MVAMLLLAVPGIALADFPAEARRGFRRDASRARFFPQMSQGVSFHAAIVELYDSRRGWRRRRPGIWWPGSARAAAPSSPSGWWAAISACSNAIALEALLCTLRSIAAPVPAAIGVQEWGYAMLAPLFGLPAEMGVAVSLLKRAREIVLGVPALLYWQSVSRAARRFAAGGQCLISRL